MKKDIEGYKLARRKTKEIISRKLLLKAKQFGFSDRQLSQLLGENEDSIQQIRKKFSIKAVYKLVDTCGAEFEAYTPYYYSTYETEDESHI